MSAQIPEELLRRLYGFGASVQESRSIDHGTQYRLARGSETAILNVYASGKTSEGGREGPLRALLREYRASGKSSTSKKNTSERHSRISGGVMPNATPRVGTDEAGKGEYLGPLVVAGVRVSGGDEDAGLRSLGVRDSKDLSPSRARELAREITTTFPDDFCVVSLYPEEYHDRWISAGRNVNRLLSELNVEIIGKLKRNVEVAVVDAFGRKAGEYVSGGLGGS